MKRKLTVQNIYNQEFISNNCKNEKSLFLNLPLVRKNDIVFGEYFEAKNEDYLLLSIQGLNTLIPFKIVKGEYKNIGKEIFLVKDIKLIHTGNNGYEYYFEIDLIQSSRKPKKISNSPHYVVLNNYKFESPYTEDNIRSILCKVYNNMLELLHRPSKISMIGRRKEENIILLSIICHNLWRLNGIILVDSLKMEYLKQFTKSTEEDSNNDNFIFDNEWEYLSEMMGLFININTLSAKYISQNILIGKIIKEGNWIFLCPENIGVFSKNFISCFNYKYNALLEDINDLDSKHVLEQLLFEPIDDFIFKKVLLHELGHLIFSTSNKTADFKIFDETRANWFSSLFMSNIELYLLRLITAVQPYRYHKIMPIPSVDFRYKISELSKIAIDFEQYYDDVKDLFFANRK